MSYIKSGIPLLANANRGKICMVLACHGKPALNCRRKMQSLGGPGHEFYPDIDEGYIRVQAAQKADNQAPAPRT